MLVAALVVWFYRVIVEASRETYKAFLPSSTTTARMGSGSRSRRAAKGRRTPWGWNKSASTKGRVSVGVPAHARNGGAQIGWPYRNEPFDLGSGGQTATGSGSPAVSNKPRRVSKSGMSKPWGW